MVSRLTQGLRLAEVLTMPGALGSFLTTRPFSSSAFLLARDLRAGCPAFGTIVDVGANAGQFAVAVAREFPDADVIAVEPLPDVAETLRAHVADLPRIRVLQCAAGASPGRVSMRRHAYTLSSSLMATTAEFAEVFPEAARRGERSVEIDVARLDDLVDVEASAGPILLKLDVQGFEIEALKGAPRLLRRCDWVLAEAAVDRVYEGEPLFAELWEHLAADGFAFDRPVDLLRGARGTVSQMDVLFRRSGA